MATQKEKLDLIDLLLSTIHTTQILTGVAQSMELMVQDIYYDPNVYPKLIDAKLAVEAKEDVMNNFIKKHNIPIVAQKFLGMLVRHNLFQAIDDQDKPTFLFLLRNQVKTIRSVNLTLADYLPDNIISWLHQELRRHIQYQFVFDISVDQSIIGGVIIQADAFEFEDTVITRLKEIEPHIRDNVHKLTMQYLDEMVKAEFTDMRVAPGAAS